MPDEIDLTPEDEAALDKAWDEIHREKKEAAAKQKAPANEDKAQKTARVIAQARASARKPR
jgi:hypothetical protein